MTDTLPSNELVGRLRAAHPYSPQYANGSMLLSEAADEIERLTRELEESRAANWRLLGALRPADETTPVHASVATTLCPQKSAQSLGELTAALHTSSGWAYGVQAAFVLERFAEMRELLLDSDALVATGYAENIRDAAKIAAEPIWRWPSDVAAEKTSDG